MTTREFLVGHLYNVGGIVFTKCSCVGEISETFVVLNGANRHPEFHASHVQGKFEILNGRSVSNTDGEGGVAVQGLQMSHKD